MSFKESDDKDRREENEEDKEREEEGGEEEGVELVEEFGGEIDGMVSFKRILDAR